MCAHSPRPRCRRWTVLHWQELRFYQYRDDRSSIEAKLLMAKHTQSARNFTAVRSYRDPGVVVSNKDLVQPLLRPSILRIASFSRYTIPELVVLREASFDVPGWEEVVDTRLAASVVASVD